MNDKIENVIEETKALLKYQKAMGNFVVPKKQTAKKPAAKVAADGKKDAAMASIKADLGDCKRCKLCKGRTNIVFGVGNVNADIMFVGEGPGADEDATGEPFVGRAGQLLTKIINAMGLGREDVYIGNIVKCRPPENRNPEPDEVEQCMPFILRQIDVIKPKVIVALGATATKTLIRTEVPISKLRGKFIDWSAETAGLAAGVPYEHSCKFLPTFHPAFLLRNPNMKKPVWEDMQALMKELGMKGI